MLNDPEQRQKVKWLGSRLAWGFMLCVLALAAVASCVGRTDGPEPSPERGALQGGTFRLAQASPGSLDPAQMFDVYESNVLNLVFDGLVAFDANLNTMPCIAESWQISRDGLVYTFQLKQGVRFHDGTPVSAQDFEYSITRVFDLDPDDTVLAREYLSHIKGIAEYEASEADNISGIECLSPSIVRITLERPFAAFLAVMAMDCSAIVPRHYVERVGIEGFGRHPLGAGPFRFGEWIENERVVLTASDDWHMGHALLDSLVFQLPAENRREFALRAFLEGKLDAVEVPPGHLSQFERYPGIQLVSRQELSLSFIALDRHSPPFDDVRVRRAFAMAVDRGSLFDDKERERVLPRGVLPPGMPGYTPERKLLAYDPDGARALLAQAGYPGGEGLPPIVHLSSDQSDHAREVFARMADQLAEVGFDVSNQYLTWLEFVPRIENGHVQCFSLTWVADIPDPDSFLRPLFHSRGSTNYFHYASEQVDALLDTGRRARSSRQRLDVYREAERLILSEAPILPLFHTVAVLAMHDEVRGLRLTPMGVGNFPLESVWLQPEILAQEM